jgi:hypothetical protein
MNRKKCHHGRSNTSCFDCGGKRACIHNREKSNCIDCNGGGICEHKIVRKRCRECNKKAFCIHDKRLYSCVECGGKGICPHGKHKNICIDCGGASICQHNKVRHKCIDCGGASICEHGKCKSKCKECGGSMYCKHGKEKRFCRECDGSALCVHDKNKKTCKECGGEYICIHGKHKKYCKFCKGEGICEHKKYKYACKECGNNEIKTYIYCIHNKMKKYCAECDGRDLCKTPLCNTIAKIKKYNGYCLNCFIHLFPDEPNSRNYKTKEKEVVDTILKSFSNLTWITDKKVQDGCSKRRPDLLVDMGTHIVIVEIDENSHKNYECSCENKRIMELSQDLHHRSIVFIRFNPDEYILNDKIIKSCWKVNKNGILQINNKKEWEERINALKEQIQYWINNTTEKTIEIIELFY